MKTVAELLAERHEKVKAMEAIVTKADSDGDRDLTTDEQTAFDELDAEIKAIDTRIEQRKNIEAIKKASAVPASGDNPTDPVQQTKAATPAPGHIEPEYRDKEAEKGTKFARYVRALAAGKGIPEFAAKIASEQYKDDSVAKALAAGTATDGAELVPTEFSAEFIELLRPESVVRQSNPTLMTFDGAGTIQIPRLASGATGSYVGENANIAYDDAQFDTITLTPKKLGVLTAISSELLRRSNPSVDMIVRDDLLAGAASTSDGQFIRGTGSATAPTSLKEIADNASQTSAANATVNLANVTIDLGKALVALKNANVRMRRPGWLMAPRTENYLMNVRDGNGNFAFRDEMLNGQLYRMPYRTTTQIPTNLGTGTDESEVYICDFADLIIADEQRIVVSVSDTAAYHNGSAVVSSFSQDQTVVRLLMSHDLDMRHTESVYYLSAVQWI